MGSSHTFNSRVNLFGAVALKIVGLPVSQHEAFSLTLAKSYLAVPDTAEGREECYKYFCVYGSKPQPYRPIQPELGYAMRDEMAKELGYESYDSATVFPGVPNPQNAILSTLRRLTVKYVSVWRTQLVSLVQVKDLTALAMSKLYAAYPEFKPAPKQKRTRAEWSVVASQIEQYLRSKPGQVVTAAELAVELRIASSDVLACARRNLLEPFIGKRGRQEFYGFDKHGRRVPFDRRYRNDRKVFSFAFLPVPDQTPDRVGVLLKSVYNALTDDMSGHQWRTSAGMNKTVFYLAVRAMEQSGMVTVTNGPRNAKHYFKSAGSKATARELLTKMLDDRKAAKRQTKPEPTAPVSVPVEAPQRDNSSVAKNSDNDWLVSILKGVKKDTKTTSKDDYAVECRSFVATVFDDVAPSTVEECIELAWQEAA